MFSSSAKLSATSRTEPRKGVLGANLQAVKTTGNVTPAFDIDFSNVPEDDLPPLQALATPKKKRTIMIRTTDPPTAVSGMPHDRPLSGGVNAAVVPLIPRGQRATVEDFEDEVDTMSSTSKKKKKKKKPKKKQFAIDKLATVQDDVASMANTESTTLGSFARVRSKSPSSKLPDSNASMTSLGHMSTTSLAIAPTTAKSAHAYLQELGPQKEKIKSRPHHTSGFPEKKGFLSKLSGKDQNKHSVQKDSEANVKKPSVFSRLRKKTKGYMERLLHIGDEKGGLKWENLLKVQATVRKASLIEFYQCHRS